MGTLGRILIGFSPTERLFSAVSAEDRNKIDQYTQAHLFKI